MGFGTFTDMFYVFAYKKDENIFIEWKIDEDANNTIFSDLIDYPSSFFLYKIEYVKFKEFIERLDRIIANW
jgi:hypothetical protein